MPPQRPNTLDRGIRLFEHPLLDWGSRVHPALPGLFCGPVAVAALAASVRYDLGPLAIGAWFVAGYAAWMFAEYALHRWFFHFRPRSARLQRVFYVVHEHHHRYQERDRLLAPPLMSLSIGAIFVGAFFLAVAPWVGYGPMWAFAAGFCVSYLVYDYTHYFIHFAKPRTRWGRFVRRCHLEHHFSTPDRWFCISFPPLDYLFGTQRRVGTRSDVARPQHDDRDRDDRHRDDWSRDGLPPLVRRFEDAEHEPQQERGS